ncbi:LINE-1 reverse transcriptase like protein [Myotis davidii]|uniref:LINE-1 reverse transcriptase like protein n=1 Tax=Myotis davidii TaxID=225400 RepID=L5MC33_MYODS|nr:LINE-1 reverse transcriptase like protein [Myotis davidii]
MPALSTGPGSDTGHKTSLNKFKKIEIVLSIFSDHNGMNLEVNHKKETEKYTKTWRLNDMLPFNEWVSSEIREEIKTYHEINENEEETVAAAAGSRTFTGLGMRGYSHACGLPELSLVGEVHSQDLPQPGEVRP